jgi:Zn-dependent protease/predicted transcriptional regulator
MPWSLRVGRVFGIPIYLHITLLFILPVFAFVFGFTPANVGSILGYTITYNGLPLDWPVLAVLGVIAAILLFLSILAHELAHSYIAIHNGYKISGITLFFFGGVSQISEQPPQAPKEALMAFVGPGTSFLLGAIFSPLFLLTKDITGNLPLQALAITFSIMGFYNLFLGAFNLIPAFPMDGGRILRAALVKRMGFMKGTEAAVFVGKIFAIVLGVLGIFISIWFILIAFFIYIGADEELRVTRVQESLRGMSVKDIMSAPVSTVTPDMSVRQVLDKVMVERHKGFPVVDSGRIVGLVTLHDLSLTKLADQDRLRVRDVMQPRVITVSPGMEAMEAFKKMTEGNVDRILVMEGNDLLGIVSRTDLMRAMELRQAQQGAGQARPMMPMRP